MNNFIFQLSVSHFYGATPHYFLYVYARSPGRKIIYERELLLVIENMVEKDFFRFTDFCAPPIKS